MKPFLRWAGSKRQLLPVLSTYWSENHERYLEPFVGSACLFFRISPKKAILGDINSNLIAMYDQVKTNLDEVLIEISYLRKSKDEYYRIRSLDSNSLSPAQQAARFIYLNRFSFNGLYRTNRKGQFNVPYGGGKSGILPNREMLEACKSALQSARLFTGDFEIVLKQAKPGDFVYMDPPYKVAERRVFNEYDSAHFSTQDLYRLRDWLRKLTQLGVEFLLSYAMSEEATILRKGFSAIEVDVKRNIAGFTNNRRRAGEWLISNKDLLTTGRRDVQ